MEAFGWVMNHWLDIGAGITSAIGLFSVVAKLTPTPKDDAIANSILVGWTKIIDFLALNKQR